MQNIDTRVRFIHRRPSVDGKIPNSGGFTVAYREVDGGIEYAFAHCSPRDNFSREMGRVKATGRLGSLRYRCFAAIDLDSFKDQMYSDAFTPVV